jgi:hypothetical protein
MSFQTQTQVHLGRFAQVVAPNVQLEGFSVQNGKSPDTSGGGGLLITKHVDVGKRVLGADLAEGLSSQLGAGDGNITYHMWLRINKGKRAASIFQLGAAADAGICATWNYMISLEMTYPPGESFETLVKTVCVGLCLSFMMRLYPPSTDCVERILSLLHEFARIGVYM